MVVSRLSKGGCGCADSVALAALERNPMINAVMKPLFFNIDLDPVAVAVLVWIRDAVNRDVAWFNLVI